MEEGITLYPSNWLYNAGVIGFLEVISYGESDGVVEKYLKDDGSVEIYISKTLDEIFEVWDLLTQQRLNISYKGKKGGTQYFYYTNQTENSIKKRIEMFMEKAEKDDKNKRGKEKVCVFCHKKSSGKRIAPLDQAYSNILLGGVKNFYWNSSEENYVCDKCQFILMCHHIGFITLFESSNSIKQEIFINAPSFKVMWYLNKYVKEMYGKSKIPKIKELLGISLIEMALKLNIQLGRWTMMNIEVISKNGKKIDFFNLPYETTLLLSDRNIASLLADIAELNVLDMVLNSEYKEILEVAERIFKISLKKEKTKQEKEFINSNIKLDKNKNNLISYSQKLFKLYGLIEEKIKKEVLI